MMEMIVLFAKSLPEQMILDELTEAVEEFKITKNPEAKKKIKMYALLLLTKEGTEGKEIGQVIKEFEKRQQAVDLMRTRES